MGQIITKVRRCFLDLTPPIAAVLGVTSMAMVFAVAILRGTRQGDWGYMWTLGITLLAIGLTIICARWFAKQG